MKPKFATVFGGSELGPETTEYQDGVRLGKFLVQQGYTVKCGGYYGLMEAVARGVREAGGTCIGITNASFDPKPAGQFIFYEDKAPDIFDRIRKLIIGSELFVVQKGSLGTLEELITVWCLTYTHSLEGAEICLIGECWPDVLTGLKSLAVKPKEFSLLKVYDTMNQFFTDKTKSKSRRPRVGPR